MKSALGAKKDGGSREQRKRSSQPSAPKISKSHIISHHYSHHLSHGRRHLTMGSQMMMTVSSAQKKAGLKAECLVLAEASAVQMVVMAGTYNAPESYWNSPKLFQANIWRQLSNRNATTTTPWNALWLFIKNPL